MINELYKLSEALSGAGIETETWHRKYIPLPKITRDKPCYRVTVSDSKVVAISCVDSQLGLQLRKYGSNQGTYPIMNLASLYRVTDAGIKKALSELRPEELDSTKLDEIRRWCTQSNWGSKFLGKYKVSMENTPAELRRLIPDFEPLAVLVEETKGFSDPEAFHQALKDAAFGMLERREDVDVALGILFYCGDAAKSANTDFGSISIALESQKLVNSGIPALCTSFVSGFNAALLAADAGARRGSSARDLDAFGIAFDATVDEPMPEVKLAGGISVKLRTMFKEQACQQRYGRLEGFSYPLAPRLRKEMKSSLEWLGKAERKGKTWLNTSKDEILFAYPERLPSLLPSLVDAFGPMEDAGGVRFAERAKKLVTELRRGREPGTDSHADGLQLFILRKLDKARTKVVYTRHTDASELEQRCEAWSLGCGNLPALFEEVFGAPRVLYPLEAADILNRYWKQDGSLATDKFKPVPKYHGMELLLEAELPVSADLHNLAEQGMNVGGYVGSQLARNKPLGSTAKRQEKMPGEIRDMLTLIALLLYREGIRKEKYMESLPYLYGQLLKVSDELHALYCRIVRNGDVPPQLAGSGLYPSAAEAPVRTLNLLAMRMSPYITWAKSYRYKDVNEKGRESWRAGWLLSMYEGISTKLYAVWQPQTRFNDEEKAQLFLGYLAEFPKRERSGEADPYEVSADRNETTDEDQGGND